MDNVYQQTPEDAPTPQDPPDIPPPPDDIPPLPPDAPEVQYDAPCPAPPVQRQPVSTIVVLALVFAGLLAVGIFAAVAVPILAARSQRPDPSQTLDQAYAAGAPRIDKVWTVDDYRAFQAYVESLPENAYPRSESTKSGELFNTFLDSMDPLLAPGANDVSTNTLPARELMEVSAELMMGYARAHDSGEADYTLEISHLFGMQLDTTCALIETGLFDDPINARQVNAVTEAQRGGALILNTIIAFLADPDLPDQGARIIAQHLRESGPTLFAFLDHAEQKRVLARVVKTIPKIENRHAQSQMRLFEVKLEIIHAETTAE